MSAKYPALFFKTKEQLFAAKEDYERMGFLVKYNLQDLTLQVYQDTTQSKKYKKRQARISANKEYDDEQYTDNYY